MAEKLIPAKKVKNGVLYKSGHIKVSNIRASYPHLGAAYGGDGEGEPKYGIVGLLPKKTHKEIYQLLKEQIEVAKKNHKTGPLKVAPAMLFLKDGDVDYPDKPECAGMWVLSARESKKPEVFNIEREELTTKAEIEEEIYGGCWVSMVIRPWTQDNKYGKRVNANLVSVLKRKDDEQFGEGRVDTSDAWDDDEDWEDDDEDWEDDDAGDEDDDG